MVYQIIMYTNENKMLLFAMIVDAEGGVVTHSHSTQYYYLPAVSHFPSLLYPFIFQHVRRWRNKPVRRYSQSVFSLFPRFIAPNIHPNVPQTRPPMRISLQRTGNSFLISATKSRMKARKGQSNPWPGIAPFR